MAGFPQDPHVIEQQEHAVRTVVLGAGVVGTTTAYFLAEAGHDVTVIERQSGAGQETSFANGAQISACHAKPWAGPGVPWQSLRWMFSPDAPLLFKPLRWDPALWKWGLKFLANCTPERLRVNMDRTLRVALYSRDVLKALRQRTNIQYHHLDVGILHIYRTPEEFEEGRKNAIQLQEFGLPQDILTPEQCVKLEPALAGVGDLAGGLFSPGDESGDAQAFTVAISELARAKGVDFHFSEHVQALETSGNTVARVRTDRNTYTPDAVVLALGSYSPIIARDLNLSLPIYPAKGYSITVALDDPTAAPTISITDETRYMVFSRLGNRLRVAGTAELAGWNTDLDPRRIEPLIRNAKALFPKASAYTDVNAWTGLRPTTPDSVPIIGKTPYTNLYLNTGHGTLGWTMACGSARIVTDMISGRKPEIDLHGLELDRFS